MIEYGITNIKVGIDIPPNRTLLARLENKVLTEVLQQTVLGKPASLSTRAILAVRNWYNRLTQ